MKTNERILGIAREILATEGLGAVSFDAIARRLGRSKQAVLYWYPSKHDLLSALYLPCLQAEGDIATRAVADVVGRDAAIDAFVRAVAAFHLADLDRFRMTYLLLQTIRPGAQDPQNATLLEQVHPLSDRIYAALAAHLEGEALAARREAVVIHSAILGLVLMFGLADSMNDPLKHSEFALIDALVTTLQRG